MATIRTTVASACLSALLAACGGGGGGDEPPPPAPTLSDRSPGPAAADATDAYVMVKFSEPMDAASLETGISVSRAGGDGLAGTVSASGELAYFIPSTPFPAAATLVVSVSADVRSAAGARLGTRHTWSFTTAHWRPVTSAGAPTARTGHSIVWTGSEMIVWGGTPATLAGGRYHLATDSWSATSTAGAPTGRTGHTAIWTGTEMIVWGGTVGGTLVATGGRYDPGTNTWRSVSTTNAPTARSGHTAIWTGTEMIVWGGAGKDLSGGRYDAATDSWTPTSLVNAPAIDASHRAVWTGSRMAVWGGYYAEPSSGEGGAGIVGGAPSGVQIGALYDPASDTWTPITTTGAPAGRQRHVLAWTGTELVVWGGGLTSGGRYSPASGAWIPTAEAGAPPTRLDAHSAWTGSHLLIWGGLVYGIFDPGSPLANGALFDPATDGWTPVATAGSGPALQRNAASVWTGSELVVWGGEGAATGARFTP